MSIDHFRAPSEWARLARRIWLAVSLVCALAARAADPDTAAAPATETAAAIDAAAVEPPAGDSSRRPPRRYRGSGTIDDRVNLLAAELGLDAGQRAGVKAALEAQREQIRRLWNETSLPGGTRVAMTQKVSDQTADRIRALLTDEQRKKYIQPRQRDAPVGASGADVDAWMRKTGARPSQ